MQIGALARATGTKVTTIRFYEQIGLLRHAPRTAAGRRTYARTDVERLNFIRNARRLGFSVHEVRSLIALADQPDRDCQDAATIAARHLAKMEDRLRQLTALRDELASMRGSECSNRKPSECKIIQAIARAG